MLVDLEMLVLRSATHLLGHGFERSCSRRPKCSPVENLDDIDAEVLLLWFSSVLVRLTSVRPNPTS